MKETTRILAFEPDLLFSSRIESLGQKLETNVQIVSNLNELLSELRTRMPSVLILNLDALEGRLTALEEFIRKGSYTVYGYCSHINAELAREAKQIGIANVMTRGTFVIRIEDELRRSKE